jgi:hypothetical protein
MKNIKFILAIVSCTLFSSCGIYYLPSPKEIMYSIDYSEFQKEGIFISESNSVSFPYKADQSIIIQEYGGYEGSKYVNPTYEKAISSLIKHLKKNNSNGIINFRHSTSTELSADKKTYVGVITLKGMAISMDGKEVASAISQPYKKDDNRESLGNISGIDIYRVYIDGDIVIYSSKKLDESTVKKVADNYLEKGKKMMFCQESKDGDIIYADAYEQMGIVQVFYNK